MMKSFISNFVYYRMQLRLRGLKKNLQELNIQRYVSIKFLLEREFLHGLDNFESVYSVCDVLSFRFGHSRGCVICVSVNCLTDME